MSRTAFSRSCCLSLLSVTWMLCDLTRLLASRPKYALITESIPCTPLKRRTMWAPVKFGYQADLTYLSPIAKESIRHRSLTWRIIQLRGRKVIELGSPVLMSNNCRRFCYCDLPLLICIPLRTLFGKPWHSLIYLVCLSSKFDILQNDCFFFSLQTVVRIWVLLVRCQTVVFSLARYQTNTCLSINSPGTSASLQALPLKRPTL